MVAHTGTKVISLGIRLVVKNTFLDLEDEEPQPQVNKSRTAPLIRGVQGDGGDATSYHISLEPGVAKVGDLGTGSSASATPGAAAPSLGAAAAMHTALKATATVAALPQAAAAVAQPPTTATCGAGESEVVVQNALLHYVDADERQPAMARSQTGVPAVAADGDSRASGGRDAAAAVPHLGDVEFAAMDSTTWAMPVTSEVAKVSMAAAQVIGGHAAVNGAGGELHEYFSFQEGKDVDDQDQGAQVLTEKAPTTLMLRNLPCDYTRTMLLTLLEAAGLAGKYNFVYMPVDFARLAGKGYAFVNMVSAADALKAHMVLEGFRDWLLPSSKVLRVGWSVPCQGYEANVQRYRNNPIMHTFVPDCFKPVVFSNGVRIPFPEPTKRLKMPSVRRSD